MKLNWKVIAGVFVGLIMAGGTVLAQQFSPAAAWGIRSSLIFAVGILILVSSVFYREGNLIGGLIHTRTGNVFLASAALGSFIILIYIWVISIGTWTSWPPTTDYYDLLANAFSHGQLQLETKPDPALLALADPYNPDNREGIPVLWDATLYNGEYYLYWGPVPALLLASIKPLHADPVGDNVLTLTFMAGLLAVQIILMLGLWKSHFQEVPAWVVLLSISFVGLVNPILYMLLEARIYEAAVVSGQFFFLGGLFWLFAAFRKPSIWILALAGIFFTCAVGSRTTLAIPIGFLSVLVLIWAVKAPPAQAFRLIIAFALPLVMGAAGYCLYNYERFGSFTEFGLGYQLTQTDIHQTLNESFSLSYAPPNLFKLLINPFETKSAFPFIKATSWGGPAWYQSDTPGVYDYFAEDITGMLIGSPFLIFALLAGTDRQKNMGWITAALTGCSVILFLTLLFFFYLTMRYLLDLLPALSLLACIGFWRGFSLVQARPVSRAAYAISASGLWAYSIVVSFLICYSNNVHRIRIYNPDLIQKLTWTFNHVLK